MFLSLLMEQLNNLFSPVTRDQRQNESVDKWMKFKGRASVVAATGTGFVYAVTAFVILFYHQIIII